MPRAHRLIAAAAILAAAVHVDARIDVRVEYDKTYPFKSVRTWTWASPMPGEQPSCRCAAT